MSDPGRPSSGHFTANNVGEGDVLDVGVAVVLADIAVRFHGQRLLAAISDIVVAVAKAGIA